VWPQPIRSSAPTRPEPCRPRCRRWPATARDCAIVAGIPFDGLGDNEEYAYQTDPQNNDTDGDGLWDGEELHRCYTSPVSVDTDGDARGPDPSTASSTLPPYAGLFDGHELYTPDQRAVPPGERGAIKLGATSPALDDTDGDGVFARGAPTPRVTVHGD